jgi:DNA-binding IclR family transcriptional regulator
MQANQSSKQWGAVLTALYRSNTFTSPAELVKLSGQDLDTVKICLAFLLQQGWVEKLADDVKYACVFEARAVMQSLERSDASARL